MSTATTGITNLYLYSKYVNDVNDDPTADSSAQETLKYVIDQTNELIGQKCARNFGSAEYKEWVDTKGESYVVLNNYPITKVKLVAPNADDYLTVEGTGFSLATVSSNNASMILTSIATDGATETENVLNYSSYSNVASLVTAIDLVSGWDAETLGTNESKITELLRPIESGWALDEKVYLSGPYLGSSARVSCDSDAILDLGSDYWGEGYSCSSSIFVWYVAGYTLPVCDASGGTLTTVGNVPEALTYLANVIVKDYLDSKDEDRNMKSEKDGDYSYTRDGISSAIDRHWSDLNQYARKSV